MRQQMVLGDFPFSLGNRTAYEGLVRRSDGGWVAVDIVGAKPRSQNTGQGFETIKIHGKWFGQLGMDALDQLRALQKTREPQILVTGSGYNWGRWKIMQVVETQRRVIHDGTAQIVEFSLELEEFPDDPAENPDPHSAGGQAPAVTAPSSGP